MRKSKFVPLFVGVLCALQFPVRSTSAIAFTPSKAECVMEATSRRVLYESHGDVRLPMASTTKIATALTVLKTCEQLDEEVVIPKEAVGIEGSSVYLQEGERYTIKDLLYGLMLRSGNDCAVALAYHVRGGVAAFATLMNETAQRAGALSTRFRNPHGLPCKGHYTTARDLALISSYAMEDARFREIVATQYYEPRGWLNKNKTLRNYEGANGVKTGYTKEAGRCLVTAAKREGMQLVSVVLNSPQMYERSAQLLDDAFQTYDYKTLLKEGEEFSLKGVRCKVKESFSYPLSEGESVHVERKIECANGKQNAEILGQIQIYLAKRLLFSTNLYKL